MTIENLLVGLAMAITFITGLAIRSAMRGRRHRTASEGSWPSSYAADASDGGSFASYSASDDGTVGGDHCSDASDAGGTDGGCDAGGGDSGGDGGGSSSD